MRERKREKERKQERENKATAPENSSEYKKLIIETVTQIEFRIVTVIQVSYQYSKAVLWFVCAKESILNYPL